MVDLKYFIKNKIRAITEPEFNIDKSHTYTRYIAFMEMQKEILIRARSNKLTLYGVGSLPYVLWNELFPLQRSFRP